MIDQLQEDLIEAEPMVESHSEFIGLAAKVESLDKVNNFYIAAAQRYPAADHIMAGYALKEQGIL